MLDQFQQAFSDLVGSPAFVSDVRERPEVLYERYELSELEWRRLVHVVNQKGMECNCMLYRANRLVPIAMNLPELCKVLEKDLRAILSEYWTLYPRTDVHFLLESYRFCEFLKAKFDRGDIADSTISSVLAAEMAVIAARLEASYTGSEAPAH
jgi:hypothetical protein